MNETLKTIAERYSCRDFADTPLTDEQIKALADAALAAPSAVNRQPWHITVITDKALIDEMDAEALNVLREEDKPRYDRVMADGGTIFYNAPCMLMVSSDGSKWANMDCGILCQNVALAAHSLGLGSLICGMARIPLSGIRGEEFKKRLHFPDGYDFGIAVLVGKAKSGKDPHELDRGKVTLI
ncbi:MAG TPA: nitroreductase family protein [Oscillospiraceae bacterium]|jgi:nitroreductase|nr:nitroreductase family protein [Oscillospiraceae bacterium]